MYNYLGGVHGYSPNAVAGIAGNMWVESHINPGCWEYGQFENYSRGYGLGQWTPASKLVNWAVSMGLEWRGNGDNQLAFLDSTPSQWNDSYDPGAPSVKPPVSFEEYKHSSIDPGTLAEYWLYYWEQPSYSQSSESKQYRIDHALKYYEALTGITPEPPHGGGSMKKIFMYALKRPL